MGVDFKIKYAVNQSDGGGGKKFNIEIANSTTIYLQKRKTLIFFLPTQFKPFEKGFHVRQVIEDDKNKKNKKPQKTLANIQH